jgi:tRNA nucleotidyltransferase (CCA-adding enzyme)
MQFNLPGSVKDILEKFDSAGFQIYIVGGAVRDLLMGGVPRDWDFTTNATPEEILKIIPGGLYNNLFGTVFTGNPDDPQKPHEITTFRKEEGYSDSRHPDKISWGKTLEEDLGRRDFTINSLAYGLGTTDDSKNGELNLKLIDLYKGQDDIKNRLIRAVGNADERFGEDALRMMRAVRIATELGFKIEEKTFTAIKNSASLIQKVSKERIKEEFFKVLGSVRPYEGMLMFIDSGLMQELIPELTKCFGVEQKSPGRHHIYDVGTHLLMALKNCKSEDVITRFATLIHDIGKPQTFRKLPTGVITFYNHEMVSTKIAQNLADRLRLSKKEKLKLITLVRYHQFTVDENQTDSAIRRFIRNVGVENIPDMIALRTADRLGSGSRETSWRTEDFKKRILEVQKQPFSVKDLKINGRDVMEVLNLKPGPKVGEILEAIFKEVEEKKVKNEREILIKKLSSFAT